MSPRSPRSPASAGSRSRPARLGRPSRRCWSRRGCPARSTTACSAAWTARALAGRSGRTRRPRTRPAPGGCRAGRGRPAGVGPTRRPAPGKGTRPAGNEREGQPRRGLALSRGAGGPSLLSWGRREQSTDGPGGEGCRRDHSHVRCPGRALRRRARRWCEGPRHSPGRPTAPAQAPRPGSAATSQPWAGQAPQAPAVPRAAARGPPPRPATRRHLFIRDLPDEGGQTLVVVSNTVSGLGTGHSLLKPPGAQHSRSPFRQPLLALSQGHGWPARHCAHVPPSAGT